VSKWPKIRRYYVRTPYCIVGPTFSRRSAENMLNRRGLLNAIDPALRGAYEIFEKGKS